MFEMIGCAKARELVSKGGQLVDVRSPEEFRQTGLPGAVNLPLHTLPLKVGELDTNRPVIVYCLSGGRSGQAQALLRTMGFTNVFNLGSFQNFYNC